MPKDDSGRRYSKHKQHYQYVYGKTASPRHSRVWFPCSEQDCRQRALVRRRRSKAGRFINDSKEGPLQTHSMSRETCLPSRMPRFRRPTHTTLILWHKSLGFFFFLKKPSTLFCLWCFICFPYHSTHFITTLEPPWDAMGCMAARRSTTGFSIPQHHPGLAWQSHRHFTAHPPGAKNREGSFPSTWDAISVINEDFSKLRQRARVMHGQKTSQSGRTQNTPSNTPQQHGYLGPGSLILSYRETQL